MIRTYLKQRFRNGLIAFGLWVMVVLLFSTRTWPPVYNRSWLDMLRFAAGDWFVWAMFIPIIIYLNRRLPVPPGAFLQRFLYHIPLSLVVTTFALYVRAGVMFILGFPEEMGNPSHPLDPLRIAFIGPVHVFVMIYWSIVGIRIAYEYSNLLRDREIWFSKARLDTLRAQMHPHFLFNALNTISAHVMRDRWAACRLLEQLGELLRYSLEYSEEQEIALEEEIAFIDRYLALQKARYKTQLEVDISVTPETLNALVPTFVLEPLVENAIHHGLDPDSQKMAVKIFAKKEKERLHLSVRDHGAGLPPNWNLEQSAGIGIRNTRERLRCLYRENFVFNITNAEGGGVLAELLLPFHSATALSEGDFSHDKNSHVNCG